MAENSWLASIIGKRWVIVDNLIAKVCLSSALDMHFVRLAILMLDLHRLMDIGQRHYTL